MPIDQQLFDEINKRADDEIVRIISSFMPVTQKGKEYLAKCPFHDDSNPSMHISPEKKIFKCFVCGTGGNAVTFISKYLHIPYIEAIKKAAEILGINDERLNTYKKAVKVDERKDAILKCLKDLTSYYEYALNTKEGKEGLDYFENRHLDNSIREKFKLGYAFKDGAATCNFLTAKGHSLKTIEDTGISKMVSGTLIDKNEGRVVFPLCDYEGNVIGFSARKISNTDEAKYVNSPETYVFHKSNVLYNYHIAKDKAKNAGHIYICEGFMDVIALSKIGIDNAVAVMGTALTNEHIDLLRGLNVEIRLCLDGDAPGQEATMKCIRSLSEKGISCFVVDNQNSKKDPDEILNEDGEDALRTYLKRLLDKNDFALNYYKNTNPLRTIDEKKSFLKGFLPILLGIKSSLELDSYLRKVSEITGFEFDSLKELIKNSRGKQQEDALIAIKTYHPERKLLQKLQLAERELLYQMLNNKQAIDFYENELGMFYNEIYRQIATFVLEFAQNRENFYTGDIINALQLSDIENKNELIDELTDLSFEKNHPKECTDVLLENLLSSINEEKQKIFEKDTLEESLKGKDPLEQARILTDYNKRKHK